MVPKAPKVNVYERPANYFGGNAASGDLHLTAPNMWDLPAMNLESTSSVLLSSDVDETADWTQKQPAIDGANGVAHQSTSRLYLDPEVSVAIRASAAAAALLGTDEGHTQQSPHDWHPHALVASPRRQSGAEQRGLAKAVSFPNVPAINILTAPPPGSPLAQRLITTATERLAQIEHAEHSVRKAEADASRAAAQAVSEAASDRLKAVETQQRLLEAAAAKALEARNRGTLTGSRSSPATDRRLHADQEGWHSKDDEDASRMCTYREWVSMRTTRSGKDLVPDGTKPDVVFGLWTCCESLDPDAPGCVHTVHSDAALHCLQCGHWVMQEHWAAERCYYHPGEPHHERWGGVRWDCCGKTGLARSRYGRGEVQGNGHKWQALISDKRTTTDEACQRSGCQLESHRHDWWPTCSHCDELLPDTNDQMVTLLGEASQGPRSGIPSPECLMCGHVNRVCTQCKTVAPGLDKATAERAALTGEPTDTLCRFHPGLWTTARRTRMAVGQPRRRVGSSRHELMVNGLIEPPPAPPPSRPPSPLLIPPVSPPPSTLINSPRRWTEMGTQADPPPMKKQGVAQTQFQLAVETQTDSKTDAEAQTEESSPHWCEYHTNRRASQSLVIGNWASIPTHYFRAVDRTSSSAHMQHPEMSSSPWTGPSPFRQILNASRHLQGRVDEFAMRMTMRMPFRSVQRLMCMWKHFAHERRISSETDALAAFRVGTSKRWRPALAPLPRGSDVLVMQIPSLSSVQQVRIIHALNHWVTIAAMCRQYFRDQMRWVGHRVRYGNLHEAFKVWQDGWARQHSALQRTRHSEVQSPPRRGVLKVKETTLSALSQAHRTGDSRFKSAGAQTTRAWEWSTPDDVLDLVRDNIQTVECGIQTIAAGLPIGVGTASEYVRSYGTQTREDEPEICDTAAQTDFVDSYGNLSSVYTKRRGNARNNKVTEFALAGDRVAQQAVVAANKRIAARLELEARRQGELALAAELPGAARQQTRRVATWVYPSHVRNFKQPSDHMASQTASLDSYSASGRSSPEHEHPSPVVSPQQQQFGIDVKPLAPSAAARQTTPLLPVAGAHQAPPLLPLSAAPQATSLLPLALVGPNDEIELHLGEDVAASTSLSTIAAVAARITAQLSFDRPTATTPGSPFDWGMD